MMKKLLLFLYVFFSCTLLDVYAQDLNAKADSLNAMAKELSYTDPSLSLQYSSEALDIALITENNSAIAEAKNNMGIIYFNWGVYEYAIGYFYEALLEYRKAEDQDGFSRSLNNLGVCANVMNQPQIALPLFFHSLSIQRYYGNMMNVADVLNNIASIYTDLGEYENAYFYLQEALYLDDSLQYIRGKSNCMNNIGVYFEKQEKLDSAYHYYRLAYSNALTDTVQDYQKYIFLQNQARILEIQGLYSESLLTLDSGIDGLKSYGAIAVELTFYELYSSLYARKGDYKKAYDYQKMAIEMKEDLLSSDVSKKFTEMIVNFQKEQYQKEFKLLNERIQFRRNFQWALLGILVVLLFIVVLLVFYIRAKSALAMKTRELALLEKEALEYQMHEQKQQSEMEQIELKNRISHKDRELVSASLNLISKNETIDEIKVFMESITKSGQINKNSDVYKQMNELLTNALRVDTMWQDFFMHFEQVYPEFFDKLQLQYPTLSSNDLKFCAYLKINLGNKDLARIYNISEQSIKIKKNRLRKKLQLDSSIRFQTFLMSF